MVVVKAHLLSANGGFPRDTSFILTPKKTIIGQ